MSGTKKCLVGLYVPVATKHFFRAGIQALSVYLIIVNVVLKFLAHQGIPVTGKKTKTQSQKHMPTNEDIDEQNMRTMIMRQNKKTNEQNVRTMNIIQMLN